MERRMGVGFFSGLLKGSGLALVAGLLTVNAGAQTPASAGKMPDAQVEANVLKALAAAPDLANQPISTTTVYGVVTLTGSVGTEQLRSEAETIASRTNGVQKVVDEITLSNEAANAQPQDVPPANDPPNPDAQDNATQQDPSNMQQQANGPDYGPGAPEYRQPYGQHAPPPPGYGQQQANQQPNYGSQQPSYGPPQSYGQPGYGPPQGYGQQRGYYPQQQAYGGQQGGDMVTVPSGALIRIRINQTLDSSQTQPGTMFDGVVVNDVAAGGAVAIPRGATVHGTVVDAQSSGALSGRGSLSLQLTAVTLGGTTYPILSDVWAHNGGDKAVQSVNSTLIGGGIGALIGAAAGGGAGAAIGAGVGGAVGLGTSAASHNGQVYIPAEGMLTFHLQEPATVATVSQQEMDRLGQGVPNGGQPPVLRRRYYPSPYYGPVFYRPYPYPYPYPYRYAYPYPY